MPRVYQDQPLALEAKLTLTDAAHHHLSRVLRAKTGDELIVFNGKGGEYQATITEATRKQTIVKLTAHATIERESTFKIHLAQGIARKDKMDTIIQKAVEMGTHEITPLLTDKCQVKHDPTYLAKRFEHWQRIIISACEQCGRNQLPVLHPVISFEKFISDQQPGILFDPTGQQSLRQLDWESNHCSILLGPESGFSQEEISLASNNQWKICTIGPRILRTETATIVTLTALQSRWGDL